jgi:hypothetical protein
MKRINITIMKPGRKVTRRLLSTFEFINWWNRTDVEEIHPLRPYQRFVEYQIARDKPVMASTPFYRLMDIALRHCHAMHEEEVELAENVYEPVKSQKENADVSI